ncbi:MAG: hypothetical protein CME62_05645 [Halobacteriovoraceae bacterium]|nr:hypothetical protein [Halobacteriovoraceae bacterium]|tara:strand:- start:322 stop:1728 length:1407 start_codon:yes stop_codon:yes gene_type:complete
MAVKRKQLSRRTFLKGSAGIAVALPFLEVMLPQFASAQVTGQRRFINLHYGSTNGGTSNIVPSATGPLSAQLKKSIISLEDIKQHISIVSNLEIIQRNNEADVGPGEAVQSQHGEVESPLFSGVRSLDRSDYTYIRGQTADQYAADILGSGSLMRSLYVQLQPVLYNNKMDKKGYLKPISVREENGILNPQQSIISPLELYKKLFGAGVATGGGSGPLLNSNKSVLDFITADRNKLVNSLPAADKARLDLHFTKIRELEQRLAAGSGGGSTGGSCTSPNQPAADPAITTYNFGGWANETLRGEIQAELIAYALACDLTRVVTWALTGHQVWLNSNKTGGSTVANSKSGVPDIHHDSHFASKDVQAANHNWAVNHFGMLVRHLSNLSDGGQTLLDNTFLTFMTSEGNSAHGRSRLHYLVAGTPDKIKNGHHIATNKAHPARIYVDGLNAIGGSTNKLGEVSGTIPGLSL